MITYYTDGSASPNPGPGGFAVIRDGQPYILGGEPDGGQTTNIRMEGLAIMAALADANGEECQIYTDSEFWINVITKWAPGWQANGWKKKGGDIKNLDIVQEVVPLYQASKATLTWIRGHEGDEGNEMADEWANKARERKATAPEKLEQVELSPYDHAWACLAAGRTMQLGTVHDDAPRVNSVFFVADNDARAVYWLSEPGRRHSQDIMINDKAAGAIVVRADTPVVGVQLSGRAHVVADEAEVERISVEYSQKYAGVGADFHIRFKSGTNKHELYRLDIDSLELFDELHYPAGESPITIK